MEEPKLKYEIVEARRPYIAEEDEDAWVEEGRKINEADERDGTNAILDAMMSEWDDDGAW